MFVSKIKNILKSILNIEDKVIKFLKKNNFIIFIILMTVFAVIMKVSFIEFKSADYNNFLEPWFNEMKTNGGLKALGSYTGNYNAPYMTIIGLLTYLPINSLYSIKLVSIIFDFIAAITSFKIVSFILKYNKNKSFYAVLSYTLVLFLPTVIFNTSICGQCDIIYTTFVLISLLYLFKEKYTLSFIFLGISFAFKIQFIFIIPLYLYIYVVKRKFSIFNFFLIPIMNIVLCLPAIIYGRSIIKCFSVYLHQAGEYYENLTMGLPNFYALIHGDVGYLHTYGLIFTVVILGIMMFILINNKTKMNNENIFLLAIWSIVISTYFLPNMHERYLFMADIIGTIYYVCYRKRLYLVTTIISVSLISYVPFLFGYSVFDIKYISIIYLIQIIYFTKDMLSTMFENKAIK